MIYGSVCSGIEAASAAWHPLGWRCAFASEIEAFPRAVLRHRWPETPLHGDFTTIGAGDYDPIDLLVGGTPCQSFSVAGLRGGLHDQRGNLALEFLRLADRLRPRWVVWENVPGVLSSVSHDAPDPREPDDDLGSANGPPDGTQVVVEDQYDADESHAFACFLAGLSECGYGWAYRVLDAQFFGVAQRRRRVFVVGYLGDWRRAAAVLFERHGLQGHPAPRREAGEGAAPTVAGGARKRGGYSADDIPAVAAGAEHPVDAGLALRDVPGDERGDLVPDVRMVRPRAFRGNRASGPLDVATACDEGEGVVSWWPPEVADPISAAEGKTYTHEGTNLRAHNVVEHPVAFSIMPQNSGKDYKARQVEVAQPVMAGGPVGGNQGGDYIVQSVDLTNGLLGGDIAGTLERAQHKANRGQAVAFGLRNDAHRSGEAKTPSVDAEGRARLRDAGFNPLEECAPTLDAGAPHAVAFALRGREDGAMPEISGDVVGALRSADGGSSRDYVAFQSSQSGVRAGDTHPTLDSNNGPRRRNGVFSASAVRRLTPRECERLQGFADDYTLIPWRGGMAPDGPRYKALGNSMAVPVMAWIGRRIAMVEAISA